MFDQQHHDWLSGFRRNLFGYACALSPHIAAAEDLYQDTLARAMSARSVPAERAGFRVWMFTVLRNLWIDGLRKHARAKAFAREEHQDGLICQAITDSEDAVVNRLAVRQAFMQLSKDHRDVLALVDIGGFSYDETAKMLEIPVGTVMSRVARARTAMLVRLSDSQVIAFPARRKGGV